MEFDAGDLPFEIDVTFAVGEKLRRVFKLVQKKEGDVYVRVISGLRRGESSAGNIIDEDRISLHVSKNSPEYNAFKKTSSAVDGTEDITMQLNTAVKSGKGFAHLASIMFSDLAADLYDLDPAKHEKALVIGEFDPLLSTAFCALFVGAPGVEFNGGEVPFDIFKINTALFQVVIVGGLVSVPAISYSRTFSFGTLRPDEPFIGRRLRAKRLRNMQSKAPQECLGAFAKQIPELLVYRNSFLKVSLEETLNAYEKILPTLPPEEILLLEAEILDGRKLLNEIKLPSQYLFIKRETNPMFYIDEQGIYRRL